MRSIPIPCTHWANALAAVSHDDLPPSERNALAEHIASCSSCASVQHAYREMDRRILTLPPVTPLSQLPAPLHQLVQEQEDDLALYFVEGKEYISVQHSVEVPTQTSSARKPRRTRFPSLRLSLTIAALLVAILASGAFYTMHVQTQTPTNTSSASGTSDQAATTLYTVTTAGKFIALDAGSGQTRWQWNSQDSATGGFAAFDNLLFISTQHNVQALRTPPMTRTWNASITQQVNTSLQVDASGVYIGTSSGITALQLDTGNPLWQFSLADCSPCNPTILSIARGNIYALSHNLYALNTNNGKMLWYDPRFTSADTQLIQANGKLYVNSTATNQLYILNADTGLQIGEFPGGTIVAENGTIFVSTPNGGLYALRTSDDNILWNAVDAQSSVYLHLQLLTAANGIIYGIMPSSTTNITPTPTPVDSATPVIPQYGTLVAFQAANGSPLWKSTLPTQLTFSEPALALKESIYINTTQGLTALSTTNGSILWQNHDAPAMGSVLAL